MRGSTLISYRRIQKSWVLALRIFDFLGVSNFDFGQIKGPFYKKLGHGHLVPEMGVMLRFSCGIFAQRSRRNPVAKAQLLIHHHTTNNGSIWVKISGISSGNNALRLSTGCTKKFVVVVDVC